MKKMVVENAPCHAGERALLPAHGHGTAGPRHRACSRARSPSWHGASPLPAPRHARPASCGAARRCTARLRRMLATPHCPPLWLLPAHRQKNTGVGCGCHAAGTFHTGILRELTAEPKGTRACSKVRGRLLVPVGMRQRQRFTTPCATSCFRSTSKGAQHCCNLVRFVLLLLRRWSAGAATSSASTAARSRTRLPPARCESCCAAARRQPH